jgi:hypothetical protein
MLSLSLRDQLVMHLTKACHNALPITITNLQSFTQVAFLVNVIICLLLLDLIGPNLSHLITFMFKHYIFFKLMF